MQIDQLVWGYASAGFAQKGPNVVGIYNGIEINL